MEKTITWLDAMNRNRSKLITDDSMLTRWINHIIRHNGTDITVLQGNHLAQAPVEPTKMVDIASVYPALADDDTDDIFDSFFTGEVAEDEPEAVEVGNNIIAAQQKINAILASIEHDAQQLPIKPIKASVMPFTDEMADKVIADLDKAKFNQDVGINIYDKSFSITKRVSSPEDHFGRDTIVAVMQFDGQTKVVSAWSVQYLLKQKINKPIVELATLII